MCKSIVNEISHIILNKRAEMARLLKPSIIFKIKRPSESKNTLLYIITVVCVAWLFWGTDTNTFYLGNI